MSANNNPINEKKTKRIAKPKQVLLVQFNQMKGKKIGHMSPKQHQWQQDNQSAIIQLNMEQQKFKQTSRNYLVALYDPKTGKVQIKDAVMMQANTKMISQVQTATKLQKWSIEHKKNMVSQFGTSKSKRKINQMLSNIIS